jgi:hypothetical protein
MKTSTLPRLAVVAVAAISVGMLAPIAAHAASRPAGAKAVNIIRDPGAERAKPTSDGSKVPVALWTVAKDKMFTAVAYGAPEFPTRHSPGPKSRGKNFFAGGTSGARSTGTQIDTLAPYQHLIRSGKARFALSGWLGGFSTQGDFATLTVTWETASGTAIGQSTIGPVTEAQRKGVTGMLKRSSAGPVPRGATQVLVTLHMVRKDGEYIDGYADNLSLKIAKQT